MLTIRNLAKTDLPMIYAWLTQPRAKFWGLTNKSFDFISKKYGSPGPGQEFAIVEMNSEPVAFVIIYSMQWDEIAEFLPETRDCDVGVHLLMAPPPRHGDVIHNLPISVLCAVREHIYQTRPQTVDIYADPDVYNIKAIDRFLQAGFNLHRVIHLPSKSAQMLKINRTRPSGHRPPSFISLSIRAKFYYWQGRIGRKCGIYSTEWPCEIAG